MESQHLTKRNSVSNIESSFGTAKSQQQYNAALYIRISLEDGDKKESCSVENQRKILRSCIEKLTSNDSGKLSLASIGNVYEYVDDGFTGTNFDRPAFVRLISDIENKKVNMVITKDLSRLGRNYVKVGDYVENYFPEKRVRYISVLDNVDTWTDSVENDLLPFMAVLNEMYSKDISLKQKSSIQERKKKGRYIACYAPYGYKKDEVNRGKLLIDEAVSGIIKEIFDMYAKGTGTHTIAKMLTARGIPTPAEHLKMPNVHNSIKYNVWKGSTVRRMLRNRIYLGDMIQNKETTLSYKNPQRIQLPESDYIVIPNHYEAIIDIDVFERVQQILSDKSLQREGKYQKRPQLLLQNLLYCGECKKKMAYRYNRSKTGEDLIYAYCVTHSVYGLCDNGNSPSYTKAESEILSLTQCILETYSDKEKLEKIFMSHQKPKNTGPARCKQSPEQDEGQLAKINKNMDMLYTDKLNGIITDEQYKRYSEQFLKERGEIQNRINVSNKLPGEMQKDIQGVNEDRKKMREIIKSYVEFRNIGQNVLENLVEKIEIDKCCHINIFFDFKTVEIPAVN